MRKFLMLVPVAAMLALAGSDGVHAATIFTGKGGVTCTFESCMTYCKQVSGTKCTQFCNKVIPERQRNGTCKS